MGISTVGGDSWSAFEHSRAGMARARERFDGAANAIARGEISSSKMVELVVSEKMYQANASVVRTQDGMLGMLLDATA